MKFPWPFGKENKPQRESTDAPLLEKLRDAVTHGNGEEFARLCNMYREEIVRQFPSWLTVPPQYRQDREAAMAFAAPVLRTAEYFQQQGDPRLMERLTLGANNPVNRWRGALAAANQLGNAGKYDQAIQALEAILKEMKGVTGTGIDDLRPKTNGALGNAYYFKGNTSLARQYIEAALAECRQIGDAEGVRVYSENLELVVLSSAATDEETVRMRAEIVKAQKLSDEGWYELSNQTLMALLHPAREESRYKSKICGLAGLNYFRLNDREKAEHYTKVALDECRRAQDAEGVRIYGANLDCIVRQHGDNGHG
jgi:tetratricopeptide (TPR) repeat protein